MNVRPESQTQITSIKSPLQEYCLASRLMALRKSCLIWFRSSAGFLIEPDCFLIEPDCFLLEPDSFTLLNTRFFNSGSFSGRFLCRFMKSKINQGCHSSTESSERSGNFSNEIAEEGGLNRSKFNMIFLLFAEWFARRAFLICRRL